MLGGYDPQYFEGDLQWNDVTLAMYWQIRMDGCVFILNTFKRCFLVESKNLTMKCILYHIYLAYCWLYFEKDEN